MIVNYSLFLSFFVFINSFVFTFLGLSLWVRGAELFFLLFIFLNFLRYVRKVEFLLFIIFFFLVIFAFLNDAYLPYSMELYFKTVYYFFISVFFGFIIARYIYANEIVSHFLTFMGWGSVILVLVSFFLFLMAGWLPGETLLGTEYGQGYQGYSRAIGFCMLVVFFSSNIIPRWLIVFILLISFSILLAFNSMGAIFSIILILLYVLWFFIKRFGFVLAFNISLLFVAILISFYDFMLNDQVFNGFVIRLHAKFDPLEYNHSESRYFLIMHALGLWLSNAFSFLFGVGPMNYACSLGYCDSYRHPHNLFVMLLVWFGVFGFFFIGIFFRILYFAILNYFHQGNVYFLSYIRLLSVLFLYFFMLSMLGGDIEQNRNLILLSSMLSVYILSRFNFWNRNYVR